MEATLQKSVTFQAIKWEVDESDENVTIHIHGLNRQNKRVTVKIPDFKPYVYLELDPKIKWTEGRLELLRAFLRKCLHINFPVKNRLVERKKNYYLKPGKFLWMAFNNSAGIRALERAVRGQFILYGVGNIHLKVHEQRANPILKLFAMRKIKPAGWIVAKRTTKKQLLEEYDDVFSCADIEMVSGFSDISAAKGVSHVTNPLIVSYDIECVSGDATGNTFPNASRRTDQIICISATVAYFKDEVTEWKTYSLVNEADDKTCPHILEDGAEVRHFKNEKALLLGWSDFINEINPDVITGYNTLSFDDNYMSERANAKLCWPKFSKMGRLIGQRSKTEERNWSSSAYGAQKFNFIDIPGRLHIDMYPVIFKDYGSLMSYTLNDVSEYFLGDKKIDLLADEMIRMWHRGGEDNIRKIVTYCNKDSYLPLKLMKKLNTWLGLGEMANVMMVSIFDLVTRGQQIRVFSQVYCLCFDLGVVCTERWADYHPPDEEKKVAGATVQNPMAGYHQLVLTYDFKSLYPTTIIAYNLCFSTFVPPDENPPKDQYHDLQFVVHFGCEHDTAVRKSKVPKVKIICGEYHYRFYKANVKKGIVPMLLEQLLEARANTRKEISALGKRLKEKGLSKPEEAQIIMLMDVLDKRQLGYKTSANSVSGNTPVPCMISGSFEYRTMEELACKWINDDNGNQVSRSEADKVLVWSDNGWTPIKYVIRHPIKKPLLRVLTHTGLVDCTEEHSLLSNLGKQVKPIELDLGDKLLHVDIPVPKDTPESPLYTSLSDQDIEGYALQSEEELAFAHGLFYAEGSCAVSWYICNQNYKLLERACKYLNKHEQCGFKVYNNRLSKVYYLRVIDMLKSSVTRYRNLFYDTRKNKRIPQYIFNASYKIRLAFFLGYYAGDRNRHLENPQDFLRRKGIVIVNNGLIGSAGLCYLMKTLGYKVSISYSQIPEKLDHIRLQCCTAFRNKQTDSIKRMETNERSEASRIEYIYDIETESHHFAAGVGNMIVHNSMYGGFGSDYSYTPFYPAAQCTTAMGRKSIKEAIDFAMEYRPDTVLVYGDSVTQDTPILLRDPNGQVVIKQISLLAIEQDWDVYGDFKPSFIEPINSSIEYHVAEDGGEALLAARHMFNGDKRWSKERKQLSGWEAWTESGWSEIKQVIRHKTTKKIYRVTTHTGTVDVTQDHSLLTDTGEQIKPVNVKVGDKLLHSSPERGLSRQIYFTSIVSNKLEAAEEWLRRKRAGYTTYLRHDGDIILYGDGLARNNTEVVSINCLGDAEDYVYDLETESGRYQAGVGDIIVKNTDSCMLKFSTVNNLEECFEIGKEIEDVINAIFPKPMYLELEKIYSKYFLLSKKRYVGYIVDREGNITTVDKKGVVIKRRDNCGYLREIYSQLIDMVMDKEPRWKMYEYLQIMIDSLLDGNVELEQLVITKSIKDNYKTQNLPHVVVAQKMRDRGKYVASGTRIRYIFTETEKYTDPQYKRVEDPDYYLQNQDTIKIDYLYYLEKQLINPLDEIMEVKFGIEHVLKNLFRLIRKGIIKNSSRYFCPRFKVVD
uniref:DNA polymerase n=1 Tax=Marseillevirus LCMAC201 TaxID=2506605 RepID=A0A481YXB9_9VIRU|nr:MAG: DNA polymerase elongation subunit family B [Marseillevirus LCMAC201]